MQLWYAAYGSNMAADRLRHYLEGGAPPGAALTQPGARDPSPPRDVRPVSLSGSVYFAWDSPTWGGGIAFYDPLAPGTLCRPRVPGDPRPALRPGGDGDAPPAR